MLGKPFGLDKRQQWSPSGAMQVFAIFTARLDADRVAFTAGADLDMLDACAQQLAQAGLGGLGGDLAVQACAKMSCCAPLCAHSFLISRGSRVRLAAPLMRLPPRAVLPDLSPVSAAKALPHSWVPLLPCPCPPSWQVLVSYLVQQGTNAEVPRLADRLLAQLLDRFPALQYKRDVLAAMFHATDEEEEAQQVGGPGGGLSGQEQSRVHPRPCSSARFGRVAASCSCLNANPHFQLSPTHSPPD